MEKIEMTRDDFQPKMGNLWVVEIDGINKEHIQGVELPIISVNKNMFGFKSKSISELYLDILEPVDSSYFKYLKESLDNEKKFNVIVVLVDSNGVVLDKINYGGSIIKSLTRSSLSYDNSYLLTNRISLQPKFIDILK